MTVPVVWREPFAIGERPYRDERPHGETIHDIVLSVPNLPVRFHTHGVVQVNGVTIPRSHWALVRPKPTSQAMPVVVTMHLPLGRGGGDGGNTAKSVIALVAAVALTVVTGGIAAGVLGPAGALSISSTLFAAGSLSAQVLAGAVGVAGALLISALTPPPVTTSDPTEKDKDAASVTGNVINPGGAIPRVIGTRRVFPPLAGDPVVETVGDDQYITAIYVLNGPHALDDIRLGDAPIDQAEDVEVETREGWDNDTVTNFQTRQAKGKSIQLQMSSYDVDPENPQNLKDQTTPENSIPVWHPFSSRYAPDEIWVDLLLPNGLGESGDITDDKAIPFRIRGRLRGNSTWINFPEIHVSGRQAKQLRKRIVFKWAAFPGLTNMKNRSAWVSAFYTTIGQGADGVYSPITTAWQADSYFSDGAGDNYLTYANISTTKLTNLTLEETDVTFYLDEGTFPKGIWDFEIKRGMWYDLSDNDETTYSYLTDNIDFFYYKLNSGVAQVARDTTNAIDVVYIVSVQSIWNEDPISSQGLAIIAIRALNRRVEALSVLASGYVPDWATDGWTNWTTTSNPAPHFAYVLSGGLNLDPLPDDLRDDDGLVDWRTACAANGWNADFVVEDMRTEDVLNLLASCGYAKLYQSELVGVAMDGDHTSDTISQVFSPRNSSNFRSEAALTRIPDGFVVTYDDMDLNYESNQTIVYARTYDGGPRGRLESVTYQGIVDVNKIETRALFDLDQARLRYMFYYLDTDFEAIVCRKGDLVAVAHDVLSSWFGSGLVESIQTSGANITGITLDTKIQVYDEDDMHAETDLHGVADMHLMGVTTGVAIRRSDGSVITKTLSNSTGETEVLTFATPFASAGSLIEALSSNDQTYGSLVVAGAVGTEYKRMLVAAMEYHNDNFSLTLVDEAPDLERA